jgi:glutamine phosphoribosylpyrophosphate amidotransferase
VSTIRAGRRVFGVSALVANLVFYGRYALQHRGQESAGIAVADGLRHARLPGDGDW